MRADLSAQMALAYLAAFDLHSPAELVSNNHFDQDGLVGVFALANPEAAAANRDMLVDVARAGDFGTFRQRTAARVSMAIAAYATPGRSPLTDLPAAYPEATARLFQELLGRLEDLCRAPEHYKDLWEDEDAALSESETVLDGPGAHIEEVPELDLAIFTVPGGVAGGGGHRFAGEWRSGLHPMALYNRTSRFAVLVVAGRNYEFTYRYETWVQYQSRRPRERVELAGLCLRLNERERGGGTWTADPASSLTPTLRLEGADESTIDAAIFRHMLTAHLRDSPAAWNPYSGTEGSGRP